MTRNQERRSCALPGTILRSLGRRRSCCIRFSPFSTSESVDLGLSDLSSFIRPEAGLLMSSLPSLVSLMICASAITPIIPSTRSRAACRSSMIGAICSSRNRRFATIMSASAIAFLVSARASGVSAHSAAAWTVTFKPGKSCARLIEARATGPAEWLSSVMMAMLYARASVKLSRIMGLRLVKGVDTDFLHPALGREGFGVALGLAAHEERDLLQFLFRRGQPHDLDRAGIGLGGFRRNSLCLADITQLGLVAVMAGAGIVVELEILAEHGQQVFLKPHDQRMYPGVEDHVCAFDTHLRAVARREILNMHGRGNDSAGNAQALADMTLHLGAEDHLGGQFLDPALNLEVIVGDEGLYAKFLGDTAQHPGLFAVVAAHADHFEPRLVTGDAGAGGNMRAIAEQEHALAG